MAIGFPTASLPQKPIATSGVSTLVGVDGSGNIKNSASFPHESILNFGAVSGVNCTAALTLAAATKKLLYIPAGSWTWTGTISASGVTWLIDKDASFPGVSTVGPLNIPDLSTLGGRVHFMVGTNGTGWRVGAGSAWLESFRNYSITLGEFVVVSPTGGYGIIGASRASDNPPSNFNTIGVGGFGYNDNTTNKEPAWGGYFEGARVSGAGAVLGVEIDCWTSAAADPLTPYTSRSSSSIDVINLWLSAGGGSGSPGTNKNSAAIGVHDNGQRFERGIVFMNAAIDATVNEAMSLYKDLKLAWYDSSNTAQSYIHGTGSVFTTKSDTAASGHETEYRRKRANGTDATGALDEAHVDRGAGWDGSALYYGTYIQHLQRSAFSGGNARFSIDFAAKNDSGTYREVSLNGVGNDSFAPSTDNVLNLGFTSFRWKEIFCANATINTSDAQQKTDIRTLNDAERRVSAACKSLFKAYRWKDSVATKGADARIHFGVIAQEVQAAFEAEGLDPWQYGLLCRDEIEIEQTSKRVAERQKTELVSQDVDAIEVVDGKAFIRKVQHQIDSPIFEEIGIYGEDGEPFMEPIFQREVYEEEENGKLIRKTRKTIVGYRHAKHQVPVMEQYEQEFREIVKTGEYRYGVRYSELFAFILAGSEL